MIIEIRKTTLNKWNHGYTSSFSNCYYSGATVCWALYCDDEPQVAVSRKRDAINLKQYMIDSNYDKTGDVIMGYMKATLDTDIKEV